MTLRPCQQEPATRRLLQLGHWPQSATPELRSHVDGCRACKDLVLLTQTFRSAREASTSAAQLPHPGILWWRAQLRRRNAAVETIQRPLLGAQIFALAITICIAAGFTAYQIRRDQHWVSSTGEWLASISQSPTFHLEVLWSFAANKSSVSLAYLIPCVAIVALLSGIVVYLASEKQ
jgi:hypothetical protein